jgi:hypothetical protein
MRREIPTFDMIEMPDIRRIIEDNSVKEITMRHGIGLSTTMTVKVEDLVEKVKANRAKHEETYKKAVGVYMDKIASALDDRKEEMEQFSSENASYEELAAMGGGLGFTPPRCYLDSYDDILAVLEMATEEELELDSQQLANIIRDKWDWEREFAASTVMYANEAN